jgi:hypothetical protein
MSTRVSLQATRAEVEGEKAKKAVATHQADCHPRHSAQRTRRSDDSVDARLDATSVSGTTSEDPALREVPLRPVDDEADGATGAGANGKRGEEDAGW